MQDQNPKSWHSVVFIGKTKKVKQLYLIVMETNKVAKTLISAAISVVTVLCQTSLLYVLWRYVYNFYPDAKLFLGLGAALAAFLLAGIMLFFAVKDRDREMVFGFMLGSFLVWTFATVPFTLYYFSAGTLHAEVVGVPSKEYFSFGFAGRVVVFTVKLNSTRELTLKIFNTGSKWVHLNVTGRAVSCTNIPAGMVKVVASKSEVWVPPHGEKTVRLYIYTEQDANCTIGVSLAPLS